VALELWGIPNCDQVRKARTYLDKAGANHLFRDIRKTPPSPEEWRELIAQDCTGTLINTKSPSFRKTGIAASELDAETKLQVLTAQPTAMKRPVLIKNRHILCCGFSPDRYAEITGADHD
jgi:Spx/MgsR family transcriptional regulator